MDPVTLGLMGAGVGLSLFGGLQQGFAQGDALDTSAQIARQNAQQAEWAGAFDATRQSIISSKKIAGEQAGYAASGVSQTSGSVLNVLASAHANAELDRQSILHGADVRAIQYENQASMDEISASSARQGAILGAFGTAFKGGAMAYGMGSKPSNPNSDGDDSGRSPFGA